MAKACLRAGIKGADDNCVLPGARAWQAEFLRLEKTVEPGGTEEVS